VKIKVTLWLIVSESARVSLEPHLGFMTSVKFPSELLHFFFFCYGGALSHDRASLFLVKSNGQLRLFIIFKILHSFPITIAQSV
jgi:hypothetical protein